MEASIKYSIWIPNRNWNFTRYISSSATNLDISIDISMLHGVRDGNPYII